jgi:hypothetical protein
MVGEDMPGVGRSGYSVGMWGFRMRKWYFDLTTPNGDVVVCYWAEVALAGLRAVATAVMEAPAGGKSTMNTALGTEPEPAVTAGGGGVTLERLQVELAVEGRGRTGPVRLHEDARGSVVWEPRMLRGRGVARIGGRGYEGSVYAELLDMTLPPWQLPFRVLEWGRVATDVLCCTWVRWSGGRELSMVVAEEPGGDGLRLSEAGLGFGACEIDWDQGRVLRDETLGAGVLGSLPMLAEALPPAFLKTHELRRVRRARVRGERESEGWAITETVRFGKDER